MEEYQKGLQLIISGNSICNLWEDKSFIFKTSILPSPIISLRIKKWQSKRLCYPQLFNSLWIYLSLILVWTLFSKINFWREKEWENNRTHTTAVYTRGQSPCERDHFVQGVPQFYLCHLRHLTELWRKVYLHIKGHTVLVFKPIYVQSPRYEENVV